VGEESIALSAQGKAMALSMLDMLWMNHLADMEALSDSVRLRAYGQHDPLAEYKHEGHKLFKELLATFDAWVAENSEKLQQGESKMENVERRSVDQKSFAIQHSTLNNASVGLSAGASAKVGRNDPCPCGAKHADGRPMKYKKCHGR
jgi:preprotein translocase subunit SecA